LIDLLLQESEGDWRMYVPVLRAKASEWNALESLGSEVRHRIAPLLEFVPDWQVPGANSGGRKRRAPQTYEEYVHRFLELAVNATPSGTRAFVYFGHAGPGAIWKGLDLWSSFESQVSAQVRLVPTVDLQFAANSGSLTRTIRARGEVALRISASSVNALLRSSIQNALQTLGAKASSAHLIFDLKSVPSAITHAQIRQSIGSADEFASLVVLAGIFPQDLSKYQMGVTPEPRTEWQVWWRDHVSTPERERRLSFGDYTTQYAHYHVAPEEARGTVSLRYTTDDSVLVFRGRKSNSATGFGHSQMHGHCRLLVGRPDYAGAAFSWGDQRITCWTDPANGTGGFAQWRSASFSHHITLTVAQINDPAGSSLSARTWARAQPSGACP
jgi:hypothetical protein